MTPNTDARLRKEKSDGRELFVDDKDRACHRWETAILLGLQPGVAGKRRNPLGHGTHADTFEIVVSRIAMT